MLLRVPSTPTTGWRGRIFLDAGWILYVGPGSSPDLHAHHATQLVWTYEGHFEISLDTPPLERRAVLVPANAPHTLMAVDRTIALLLVEPNGQRGVALEHLARSEVGAELSAKLTKVAFPTPNITSAEARAWVTDVLQSLGASTANTELSSVSRRAIAYVERVISTGSAVVAGSPLHAVTASAHPTQHAARLIVLVYDKGCIGMGLGPPC